MRCDGSTRTVEPGNREKESSEGLSTHFAVVIGQSIRIRLVNAVRFVSRHYVVVVVDVSVVDLLLALLANGQFMTEPCNAVDRLQVILVHHGRLSAGGGRVDIGHERGRFDGCRSFKVGVRQ
jgi:hypothetical protein